MSPRAATACGRAHVARRPWRAPPTWMQARLPRFSSLVCWSVCRTPTPPPTPLAQLRRRDVSHLLPTGHYWCATPTCRVRAPSTNRTPTHLGSCAAIATFCEQLAPAYDRRTAPTPCWTGYRRSPNRTHGETQMRSSPTAWPAGSSCPSTSPVSPPPSVPPGSPPRPSPPPPMWCSDDCRYYSDGSCDNLHPRHRRRLRRHLLLRHLRLR